MNIIGWPYIISIDGDFQSGMVAKVIIDFLTPPSKESFDQVCYAVESFVALAQSGGLGGDRVDPQLSTATLSSAPTHAGGLSAVWDMSAVAIDPRGLTILFNMLAFLGSDIRAVAVQAQGHGPSAAFSTEDLPPMWTRIPFAVDDDRSGPYIEMQIEFAQVVPASVNDSIINAIETWLDCGSVQGYRDWTEPDDKSFLIPAADPPFVLTGSILMGYLHDNGVIEGGYNIITNTLINLHAILPVRSFEII